MGILNVTPDSFSDGGSYASAEAAVARGLHMVEEGADLIDVGGESSRPGAVPVPADEECRRILPVVEGLAARTKACISVDTCKAAVARAAVAAGARVINDISGLEDPEMAAVAAATGAGLVIMHMRGVPATMQTDPCYGDVVDEVAAFLGARLQRAVRAGVDPVQVVLDPGIGFGKGFEHNRALLRNLPRLGGRPMLVGVSRKSFIGRITGAADPRARTAGSVAAAAWLSVHGAAILRVHDVKDTCEALRVVATLRAEGDGYAMA